MNRTIFWRLFWKEYRLQRALWIAMAVLTTLVLWLLFEFTLNPLDRAQSLFRVAVAFPALYALGCGAMLFAGEHETGVYEFQRSLPVGARQVFIAKTAFALGSAMALLGLMWLLAFALSGWSLHPPQGFSPVAELIALGFFGVEMFLWATFFSLLSKRVLVVAILGVVAASVSVQIVAEFVSPGFSTYRYWLAMPERIALAAFVAAADFWLATRWFAERSERRLQFLGSLIATHAPVQANAFSKRFRAPGRLAILGRLLWQHWRQSYWMIAAVLAMSAPLAACAVRSLIQVLTSQTGRVQQDAVEGQNITLATYLALAAVPLLGLCAFLPDQWRRGYRFLADRGVPPKYVWLSRQLIVFAVPAALLLAVLVYASLLLPDLMRSGPLHWVRLITVGYAKACTFEVLFFAILGYLILGITVGQLGSMLFRSSVLGGFFSLLLTGLLAGWCGLMWLWNINWLWSVLPIPLVLLLATRLRTRDWLLERNTLRAWLLPGLVLIVPAAAILTVVPLYRVYTVFWFEPGFSPDKYARPLTAEERATLNLYEQARLKLKSPGRGFYDRKDTLARNLVEIAWVDDNTETIPLALKASKGRLFFRNGELPDPRPFASLARLLVRSAARLEEQGKLDAAIEQYLGALRIAAELRNWYPLRHYEFSDHDFDPNPIEAAVYARLPHWAARPGQTPERLIAAARKLEQPPANSIRTGIELAYIRARRFLDGDLSALQRSDYAQEENMPMLTILWMHVPWERACALRLLNMYTRAQLIWWTRREESADKGEQIWQPRGEFAQWNMRNGRYNWNGARELPYALHLQIHVPPLAYNVQWGQVKLVRDYTAMLTQRRAACLILALEAWKLQHGSLPKSLDELVGPYLDRVPIDPYTGMPFQYFRDGVKIPLRWSQPRCRVRELIPDYYSGTIAADEPFLWSTGAKISYVARDKGLSRYRIYRDIDRYRLYDFRNDLRFEFRWPTSEYEVWSSGWPFAIP